MTENAGTMLLYLATVQLAVLAETIAHLRGLGRLSELLEYV